jgi:hypothetical protein
MNVKAYSHQIHKKLIKFFEEINEKYEFQELFTHYYLYKTSELTIKIIGTCHKSSYIYLYPEKDKISKKYLQLVEIFKDEPEDNIDLVTKRIIEVRIPLVKHIPYTNYIDDDDDLYT